MQPTRYSVAKVTPKPTSRPFLNKVTKTMTKSRFSLQSKETDYTTVYRGVKGFDLAGSVAYGLRREVVWRTELGRRGNAAFSSKI